MTLPVRKSPRKKEYDYSLPGFYFVTICAKEKACIFSKIVPNEQEKTYALHLSAYGQIVQEQMLALPKRFPSVEIIKYVIMPNHIHAIVALHDMSFGCSLPEVIGAYKSIVTNECRKIGRADVIFQKSFHDHIIRGQKDFENIWNYIHVNPNRWTEDCFFEPEDLPEKD